MSLIINTKKPIHKPIEVTLDGKKYVVKTIDRDVLNKIEDLARKALKGQQDAAYAQLELIFGKHKALDALDIRVVNDVLNYVTTEIFKAEKLTSPEKKVTGPGVKS